MLISEVIPDGRSLMFFNALIQVSACVADIIGITQITLKMVYNILLVHNRGFAFFWLDVRSDLSTCVHRWVSFQILGLNSPSCLHTELADLWSLNGNITRRGAFLSSHAWLDLTSPETFAVTKSLIVDCKGVTAWVIKSREKVSVRRSHSRWNSCQFEESLKV